MRRKTTYPAAKIPPTTQTPPLQHVSDDHGGHVALRRWKTTYSPRKNSSKNANPTSPFHLLQHVSDGQSGLVALLFLQRVVGRGRAGVRKTHAQRLSPCARTMVIRRFVSLRVYPWLLNLATTINTKGQLREYFFPRKKNIYRQKKDGC